MSIRNPSASRLARNQHDQKTTEVDSLVYLSIQLGLERGLAQTMLGSSDGLRQKGAAEDRSGSVPTGPTGF